MKLYKDFLFAWFCLVLGALCGQGLARAQTLLSPVEFEEAQIRLELQRIIAEDPLAAPAARNALDALDQPASSLAGRQVRNRRERGGRRIVNGIPTALYPAVGALLKGGKGS